MIRNRKDWILKHLYMYSPIEIYDFVIDGTLNMFPNYYVTKENMKPVLREVLLNREGLKREDICKINYRYLSKYRLSGAKIAFNGSIFELLDYCFPEMKIKKWEANRVTDDFWKSKKNQKEYMKWLIKKEKINPSIIGDLRRIDSRMIDSNCGRKAREYAGGVFNLILLIAKVDVKEWEVMKMFHWNDEKAISAIKWLIEEKLKWSYEQVVNNISVKVFADNGLDGLLRIHFKHSPLKALQLAYPGEYTKVKNSRPLNLMRK